MKTLAAGVVAVTVAAAIVALSHPAFHALPVTPPDTVSYLAWDAMRPVAYPAVLTLFARVDPTFAVLGVVQLALFLSAAAALAWHVGRAFLAPMSGLVLLAGIVLNPQVVSYAFSALPESLMMTALMVHLTAVIRVVTTARRGDAMLAGASVAVAMLLKPSAMAWVVGLPLLWWNVRRRPQVGQLMAVWIVSLGIPVLAASAANLQRLGVFALQAAAGFQTIGLSGTLVDEQTPLEPSSFRTRLVEELQPIRAELDSLDSVESYYFYSSSAFHETLIRSRQVINEVFPDTAAGSEAFVKLNDIAAGVTRVAIPHAWRKYARHIAAHLYGLWMLPLVRRASEEPRFVGYLEEMHKRLPISAASPVMYRAVPDAVYWMLKALLIVALTGSTAGTAALLAGRLRGPLVAVAYGGVVLHAYYFVTAAAQTGLPRYVMAAWPLTMFVVVGWLTWLAYRVPARRDVPEAWVSRRTQDHKNWTP